MSAAVLFLDIDGVIADCLPGRSAAERLRPRCIRELNRVVAETGANVVVSSTWRVGSTIDTLRRWLSDAGFTGRVVDMTPVHPGNEVRGDEIQAWLSQHPIDRFAIVDDCEPMGALSDRLIRTDYDAGLTAERADALIRMLSPRTVDDVSQKPRHRPRGTGTPATQLSTSSTGYVKVLVRLPQRDLDALSAARPRLSVAAHARLALSGYIAMRRKPTPVECETVAKQIRLPAELVQQIDRDFGVEHRVERIAAAVRWYVERL